jgi:hypothetical protein
VPQREQEPPQSTPVSLPFCTPTVQVAQRPLLHIPPGHGVPSVFFFLHLPFLRFLQGGHEFFLFASAISGEAAVALPMARLNRFPVSRRRERAAVKDRDRESKRAASMIDASWGAQERRRRLEARTAQSPSSVGMLLGRSIQSVRPNANSEDRRRDPASLSGVCLRLRLSRPAGQRPPIARGIPQFRQLAGGWWAS